MVSSLLFSVAQVCSLEDFVEYGSSLLGNFVVRFLFFRPCTNQLMLLLFSYIALWLVLFLCNNIVVLRILSVVWFVAANGEFVVSFFILPVYKLTNASFFLSYTSKNVALSWCHYLLCEYYS